MRLHRLLAVFVVLASAACAHAAPDWKPAETYVVIAGALKWEDKNIGTFSPRARKDQELYDTLDKMGVPRDNMVLLLDDKATLDAIQKAVKDVAGKAKPGATLFFYYCGHGSRLDNGKVALLNYDFGPKKVMTAADIADWIARDFKGERVFLLADCCMSGSLADAAQRLDKAKFKAVSLTSADAGNISTANWTYTQSLLDALKGDPLLDANGDGDITLEELSAHVGREMKYREMQRSGASFHGVPKTFRFAAVDKGIKAPKLEGKYALNDFVWAADNGVRRAGRVVGKDGNKLSVEFYNYTDKVRVQASDDLDKLEFRTFKEGEAVMVEWQGRWWKAKVTKVDGDFHLVHYDGYGTEWDEWVLSNRVAVGDAAVLRHAQVKQGNDWHPVTILKQEKDKVFVTYHGRPEKLDEWVAKDKVRTSR